jgi:hypothetical protein
MTFSFHPEAEDEFVKAIAYYEGCEPGLGEDFSLQIHTAIRNILAFPNAWPVLVPHIRRCLANRFPFGVLYSVESDYIFILAVMHLHRHPDYWKSRV